MMDEEKKYTEMDLIELTNLLDNHVIPQLEKFNRLMTGRCYSDWRTCFDTDEWENLIVAAEDVNIGLAKTKERFPIVAEHFEAAHSPAVERIRRVLDSSSRT